MSILNFIGSQICGILSAMGINIQTCLVCDGINSLAWNMHQFSAAYASTPVSQCYVNVGLSVFLVAVLFGFFGWLNGQFKHVKQ